MGEVWGINRRGGREGGIVGHGGESGLCREVGEWPKGRGGEVGEGERCKCRERGDPATTSHRPTRMDLIEGSMRQDKIKLGKKLGRIGEPPDRVW